MSRDLTTNYHVQVIKFERCTWFLNENPLAENENSQSEYFADKIFDKCFKKEKSALS